MNINNKQKAKLFSPVIPGSSLTTNPETPHPWEQPPTFVNPEDAMKHIMSITFSDGALQHFIGLLRDGAPVLMITRTVVFAGFTKGLYTPDVAVLLYEPTAVMFIKLAEKLGIDPVLYPREHEDMDIDDEISYFQNVSPEVILQGRAEDMGIEEFMEEPSEENLLGVPNGNR